MTELTKMIINRYEWNEDELNVLNTVGYEVIAEKVRNLDDNTFEKVDTYFEAWLFGECPKARLNYWLKKANLTEAEYNIWKTW